jgi:hypothetical protein
MLFRLAPPLFSTGAPGGNGRVQRTGGRRTARRSGLSQPPGLPGPAEAWAAKFGRPAPPRDGPHLVNFGTFDRKQAEIIWAFSAILNHDGQSPSHKGLAVTSQSVLNHAVLPQ